MATIDKIDKITIKNPTDGSSKDYDIAADSTNITYGASTVSNELTYLSINKVDKNGTDRLMTDAEGIKLAGIETGAQVNIQTDWDQLDSTAADFLKNKPSNLVYTDIDGKIPSNVLPSYVDDVIEGYYNTADGKFYEESTYTTEIEGEANKIYVSLDTNKTYRWSGSAFIEISESLALGETSTTAYAGDKGKACRTLVDQHTTSISNLTTDVGKKLDKSGGTMTGNLVVNANISGNNFILPVNPSSPANNSIWIQA